MRMLSMRSRTQHVARVLVAQLALVLVYGIKGERSSRISSGRSTMSLGSRGRGRGALSLLRTPGDSGTGQQGGSGYKLMEARVTEIVDVDSFWAQIGTASDLEKFDQLCVSLSAWCQEHGGEGMKTLPKVKEVVAVRQQRKRKEGGEGGKEEEVEETWARAMVSRQVSDLEIEVFFIDSGVSGRVGLGEVCSASSSLLYSSPAQALHCYLQGVELPDGEEEWPDDVVSQFSELVRYPTEVKAIVDKVEAGGTWFSVTLYVMYDGSWTSVGEILAEENKAKYSPLAPVYADNLVAAMATAATVSDNTAQQSSPNQAADGGVLGGGLELMENNPPLKGSDDHQPTSEEKVGHKPENKGPVTPPLNPTEEQLLFSKQEVATVETVAGDEVAVAGNSGAGEEEVVEDNGVEEGDEPVGEFSRDRGSETREIPAVSSREQSEEASLSTTSAVTTTSSDQQESKAPLTIVPTSIDPGNQRGSKVKPSPASTSKGAYNYNQRWRSESHSPLSSDDEWDESLLPPRLSGGSESTPQISPLKKNDVSSGIYGNSAQSRKRAHFQAQLETLMADGNEPSSSGPAQQHLQGRWPFYRRQEDGGVGFPEGEGGGQWMRKANQPPRRGRLRGGGRGQVRSDHTQSDYEGRPGGMRGVRMRGGGRGGRGGDRQGQRFYERFGKRDSLDSDSKQAPPPSQHLTELREIGGMTSDEVRNETDWHSWRLRQKTAKILEMLTPSTMHSFGAEVQSLLSDSSAQKLMNLPTSKGPLMVVLTCTISDSIKKPDKLDMFVQAVEQIHSVAGTNLHRLLQPALEETSHDICESLTASSDMRKARHAFSSFLGKLFISSNYTINEEYNAAVGHAVRHFLNMWSQCSHQQRSTAYADCFAALCEEIGPPMDATSKETLDEYFDGVVLENILSEKLPRSAKEIFLKVALKRASKWEGTSVKPSAKSPTPPTIQPSVQMIPSFSEKAPPPTANVAHPIPVSVCGTRTGVQVGGLGGMGMGHIPQTYQQQQLSQMQVQQIQVQQQQTQQQQAQQQMQQQMQQQTQQQMQQQITPQQLHLQQQQAQRDAVHYQITQTDPPQSAFISPPARTNPPQYHPLQPMSEQDQYAQVAEMLSSLGFPELLEKFKNVMFKDSIVFDCESEQLKTGLKEAGVPGGAITGILHYREKVKRKPTIGQHSSHSSTPIHPPSTPIAPQPPTPHQLQQPTPLSPSYQVHISTIPSHTIVPHDPQGDYGIGSPPSAYQPPHPQGAATYTFPGGGGAYQYPPVGPSTSQPGMTMQLPHDSSNSSLSGRPMQLPSDSSSMQLPRDSSNSSLTGRPMQLPDSSSVQLLHDSSNGSLMGRSVQLPADNSLTSRPLQLPADSLAGRRMQLPRDISGSACPPVMAMPLPTGGNSDGSPLAGKEQRRWGFGTISCVVCGSQTHKTEVCTERSNRFFFS